MKYLVVWTRVVEADSEADARAVAKTSTMRVSTVPVLGPAVALVEWAPSEVVALADGASSSRFAPVWTKNAGLAPEDAP